MIRVQVGKIYKFQPSFIDQTMPEHYTCAPGSLVKVINLPGAPPANTMGMCHVGHPKTGEVYGMVSVKSLTKA